VGVRQEEGWKRRHMKHKVVLVIILEDGMSHGSWDFSRIMSATTPQLGTGGGATASIVASWGTRGAFAAWKQVSNGTPGGWPKPTAPGPDRLTTLVEKSFDALEAETEPNSN
jgi:hypothetical protein